MRSRFFLVSVCRIVLAGIFVFVQFHANAQSKKVSAEEYIAQYKDLAISEMKRTGIPASITLAQGLLESANGNSWLAKEANNHFGIKCKSGWTGRSVSLDDDAPDECFRAYDKAEDSYRDHSDFLAGNIRYAALFDLEPTDYKGWAHGLKDAGYATNPQYPDMLITAIEKYSLYQYDAGNTKKPKILPPIVSNDHDNPVINMDKTSQTFLYNNILAYEVKDGDNYGKIADANSMMRWEIRKYNDLKRNEGLMPGYIIYLKPKHRKGSTDYYEAKAGESMYYISQKTGVKLKVLYKYNLAAEGQEPVNGEKVYLRFKRTAPMQTRAAYSTDRLGVKREVPTPVKKPLQEENKKSIAGDEKKAPDSAVKPERTIPVKTTPAPNRMAPQTYTVQQGETLYGIAKDHGVSLPDLMDWNNLKDLNIKPGQILVVSAVDTTVIVTPADNSSHQPYSPTPDGENTTAGTFADTTMFYYVKPGETLFSISRKKGVPMDSLTTLNHLYDNSLYTGQRLRLKRTPKKPVEFVIIPDTYVVQQGETLFGIAKKFGMTVDAIKSLNGLGDDGISPGQELRLR